MNQTVTTINDDDNGDPNIIIIIVGLDTASVLTGIK